MPPSKVLDPDGAPPAAAPGSPRPAKARASPRPKPVPEGPQTGAMAAKRASAPAASGAQRAARSAPQRALEALGLHRPFDFALHLPIRWEDETRLWPFASLRDGVTAQVEGIVVRCEVQVRARRQLLVQLRDAARATTDGDVDGGDHRDAPGADASAGARGATLTLRFLHFHPTHRRTFEPGVRVRVRGEARVHMFGREMVHPSFRVVDAATPLATTLTPVYPTRTALPQAYLRKAVAAAMARADLSERLPAAVLPRGLPTLRDALAHLHRPPAGSDADALDDRDHPAWQRLKFEELLAQQLSQRQAQRARERQRAPRLRARSGGLPERLLAALPFRLTEAQRRCAEEIAADLARAAPGAGGEDCAQDPRDGQDPHDAQAEQRDRRNQRAHSAQDAAASSTDRDGIPMHRLLQGDVGSGKTAVAALAAAIAIDAGWQCALMAPTEILAEQHFTKLVGWLAPLGVGVAWLSGSRKGRVRERMLAQVASGEARLIVGTQAMIEEPVTFARLGLAIVDEQHRFGVQQRLALRAKLAARAHVAPHTLMMSATPIPRTLAMTLFADLDVSTIDALPPGRTPVATRLFADGRRAAVIERVRDATAAGAQVYWVCPLIDESEADPGVTPDADAIEGGGRTARRAPLDLRNVVQTHAELVAALPGVGIGLLHGRLGTAEKAATMARFAAGELAVLVATTVIEVGVDVPNASLMVVEHAERFGLSQLHQLRGRVGRGAAASACVLLYSTPLSQTAKQRLKAMLETGDGFEIARRDLEIRGPGEFLGARQSGAPLLRFADLTTDEALVEAARSAADTLLREHPAAAREHVDRWIGDRAGFLEA